MNSVISSSILKFVDEDDDDVFDLRPRTRPLKKHTPKKAPKRKVKTEDYSRKNTKLSKKSTASSLRTAKEQPLTTDEIDSYSSCDENEPHACSINAQAQNLETKDQAIHIVKEVDSAKGWPQSHHASQGSLGQVSPAQAIYGVGHVTENTFPDPPAAKTRALPPFEGDTDCNADVREEVSHRSSNGEGNEPSRSPVVNELSGTLLEEENPDDNDDISKCKYCMTRYVDIPLNERSTHEAECRESAGVDGCPEEIDNSSLGSKVPLPVTQHVSVELAGTHSGPVRMDGATYECPLCVKSLDHMDVQSRVAHVKRCGRKHGTAPKFFDESANLVDDVEIQRSEAPGGLSEGGIVQALQTKISSFFNKPLGHQRTITSFFGGNGPSLPDRTRIRLEAIEDQEPKQTAVAKQSRWGWNGKGPRKGSSGRKEPPPRWKAVPNTKVIVDGFKYKYVGRNTMYFLSHFHSDHYGGLTKEFDDGIIYCTKVTANMVKLHFNIDSDKIKILPMGEEVQVDEKLTVNTFDANHCPGAACFVFNHLMDNRTYIHCGDMRYTPKMRELTMLQRAHVDTLYLDTTYCKPKHILPPQEDVICHVADIVGKESKNPKILFVFGSYQIGKERLLFEIIRRYQARIYVESFKMQHLSCMELDAYTMKHFSRNPACRVHLAFISEVTIAKLQERLDKNPAFSRVIAFKPTGWTFSSKDRTIANPLGGRVVSKGPICIHHVPYSEHSSFPELQEWVRFINPRHIVPTVAGTSQQEIKEYFGGGHQGT